MVRGNITTWMGRSGNPVLAHCAIPEDGAAGAVVLVPSPGREQVASYRRLRQPGDQLTRAGQLALRFPWTEQSDSAPVDESAQMSQVLADGRTVTVRETALVLPTGQPAILTEPADVEVASIERFGDHHLRRDTFPTGRFAAQEAAYKALRMPPAVGMPRPDIQIVRGSEELPASACTVPPATGRTCPTSTR